MTEMKVCVCVCVCVRDRLLYLVKLKNEYDIYIHSSLQQHEERCAIKNSTDGLQEIYMNWNLMNEVS